MTSKGPPGGPWRPPNPIILLHHAPLILLYLLECIVQIGSCHWVIDTYYLFNVLPTLSMRQIAVALLIAVALADVSPGTHLADVSPGTHLAELKHSVCHW